MAKILTDYAEQLASEVAELRNMLAARQTLINGFFGMGYNIVQEKAMRTSEQIRRIERILKKLKEDLNEKGQGKV